MTAAKRIVTLGSECPGSPWTTLVETPFSQFLDAVRFLRDDVRGSELGTVASAVRTYREPASATGGSSPSTSTRADPSGPGPCPQERR